MGNPMLLHLTQIVAKQETNEGTAETPGTSDGGFLCFDANFEPTIDRVERDPYRDSLSMMLTLPGRQSGKATFGTELAGAGTAGSVPKYSLLMKACGFAEAISTGTSVTYTPASSAIPSITMAGYLDGVKSQIVGARGNVKLVLEAGKVPMLQYEFTGTGFTFVDAAVLSGISYTSVTPNIFMGATLTFDAYAAIIEKMEIDIGNVITLRGSAGAATGYLSAFISGRKPKMTIDPEMVTVATKDFIGTWKASTAVALAATIGTTGGNIITISAPKCRPTDIKFGNRTGVRIFNLTADLCMNTGDDELSIVVK